MYVSERQLSHGWSIKGKDHKGVVTMKLYLKGMSECRRMYLALFLDGHKSNCVGMLGAVLCNICDSMLSVSL